MQSRPSKRPPGNKTLDFCLSANIDDDGEFEERKRQDYDFSGFQKLYETIITADSTALTDLQKQQIRDSIIYFSKLKEEITKKFQDVQKAHAKELALRPSMHSKHHIHNIPRSMSVRVSCDPFQKYVKEGQKPQKKLKKLTMSPGSSYSSRQLSATTIWNQENKFFNTIPTISGLASFLFQAQPNTKRGPIGQHYSIKYNEKLKQKFKNDSVQIRVPGTVAIPTAHVDSSPSVLFNRLLCSFAPLTPERYIEKKKKDMNIISIQPNEEEIYPNAVGTSTYTSIPFEDKLALEIESVGLIPDKSLPYQADNEIARELDEVNAQYAASLQKTAKMRETIIEKLKAAEPQLAEKAKKMKKSTVTIERPETPKKGSALRKKSRGKSNE